MRGELGARWVDPALIYPGQLAISWESISLPNLNIQCCGNEVTQSPNATHESTGRPKHSLYFMFISSTTSVIFHWWATHESGLFHNTEYCIRTTDKIMATSIKAFLQEIMPIASMFHLAVNPKWWTPKVPLLAGPGSSPILAKFAKFGEIRQFWRNRMFSKTADLLFKPITTANRMFRDGFILGWLSAKLDWTTAPMCTRHSNDMPGKQPWESIHAFLINHRRYNQVQWQAMALEN